MKGRLKKRGIMKWNGIKKEEKRKGKEEGKLKRKRIKN